MAISRDGNSEYVSNEPAFEEKAARLEEEIKKQLEQTPEQLELKGRYFAADEMAILAQSEQVRSVRILDLSDNQIDDDGLKSLFESSTLEQLEELNLSINFITAAGVQAVAQSDAVKIKKLKNCRWRTTVWKMSRLWRWSLLPISAVSNRFIWVGMKLATRLPTPWDRVR